MPILHSVNVTCHNKGDHSSSHWSKGYIEILLMAYNIEEETRSVFSLSETSPGFFPVGYYSWVLQWGTTVGIYLESCIFQVNSLNKFMWHSIIGERRTWRKILREDERQGGERGRERDGGGGERGKKRRRERVEMEKKGGQRGREVEKKVERGWGRGEK